MLTNKIYTPPKKEKEDSKVTKLIFESYNYLNNIDFKECIHVHKENLVKIIFKRKFNRYQFKQLLNIKLENKDLLFKRTLYLKCVEKLNINYNVKLNEELFLQKKAYSIIINNCNYENQKEEIYRYIFDNNFINNDFLNSKIKEYEALEKIVNDNEKLEYIRHFKAFCPSFLLPKYKNTFEYSKHYNQSNFLQSYDLSPSFLLIPYTYELDLPQEIGLPYSLEYRGFSLSGNPESDSNEEETNKELNNKSLDAANHKLKYQRKLQLLLTKMRNENHEFCEKYRFKRYGKDTQEVIIDKALVDGQFIDIKREKHTIHKSNNSNDHSKQLANSYFDSLRLCNTYSIPSLVKSKKRYKDFDNLQGDIVTSINLVETNNSNYNDLRITHSNKKHFFGIGGRGLCNNSQFCFHCADLKRKEVKEKQEVRFSYLIKQSYFPILVTYTIPHNSETKIFETVNNFQQIYSSMTVRTGYRNMCKKFFPDKFSFYGDELTLDDITVKNRRRTGPHYHRHIIIFVRFEKKVLTDEYLKEFKEALTIHWVKSMELQGILKTPQDKINATNYSVKVSKPPINKKLTEDKDIKNVAEMLTDYSIKDTLSGVISYVNLSVEKRNELLTNNNKKNEKKSKNSFKNGRISHWQFLKNLLDMDENNILYEEMFNIFIDLLEALQGKHVMRTSRNMLEYCKIELEKYFIEKKIKYDTKHFILNVFDDDLNENQDDFSDYKKIVLREHENILLHNLNTHFNSNKPIFLNENTKVKFNKDFFEENLILEHENENDDTINYNVNVYNNLSKNIYSRRYTKLAESCKLVIKTIACGINSLTGEKLDTNISVENIQLLNDYKYCDTTREILSKKYNLTLKKYENEQFIINNKQNNDKYLQFCRQNYNNYIQNREERILNSKNNVKIDYNFNVNYNKKYYKEEEISFVSSQIFTNILDKAC